MLLELPRVTSQPPVGPGPFKVTVPVAGEPPVTIEGLNETEDGDGGFTVNVAVLVTPPYVPEIVTAVGADTGEVGIANAGPLVALEATVVEMGGWATAGFELITITTAPPGGAGLSRIALFDPVEFPPTTVEGFAWICAIAVGFIVRFRASDPPL